MLYYGADDMCQLRAATRIAHHHGAGHRPDNSFDVPMIIIDADKNTLDNISADYDKIKAGNINGKTCHLH